MQKGQTVRCGAVHINDLDAPRMYVPESLMVMYQHLRNQEKAGVRTINKHTFAEFDLPKQGPQKDFGRLCRMFSATEAMRWLEKSQNHTQVEAALQKEFVFGNKQNCLIFYPNQMKDYVSIWCKNLNSAERPQCTESEVEEISSSEYDSDTDRTNSQEDETEGAASMTWQQERGRGSKQKMRDPEQTVSVENPSFDTSKGDDSKALQLIRTPGQTMSFITKPSADDLKNAIFMALRDLWLRVPGQTVSQSTDSIVALPWLEEPEPERREE